MPELPDLEIYKGNLQKRLVGRKIASVKGDYPRKINVPVKLFESALAPTEIMDIVREGKELHFLLSNGAVLGVHLMLSGRMVLAPADEVKAMKQKIASVYFDDGEALAFLDGSRWLKASLNPPKSRVPDALSEAFTLQYFLQTAAQRPRVGIKALLLNQQCIRGIGNAYADEILYRANISPLSMVGKIPKDALADLYEAIPEILKDAIEQLKIIAPDAISGEERGFLKVHNPDKTHTDAGEKILYARVEDRGTYYVGNQRFYM